MLTGGFAILAAMTRSKENFDEIDPSTSRKPFATFARHASATAGHPFTFIVACLIIIVWGSTGHIFDYSDTWQLIINTGTTIVTFLMVFLIQNSQNRDSAAMQLKLDELIRADEDAHDALMDLEELTEKELMHLKKRYEQLATKGRERLRKGMKDKKIHEVF